MAFGHYLFQLRPQLGFASQKLSQHTSMKQKKRNRNKKQSDRLAQNFRGTLNTGRGLDKSRTGVLKQINKTHTILPLGPVKLLVVLLQVYRSFENCAVFIF